MYSKKLTNAHTHPYVYAISEICFQIIISIILQTYIYSVVKFWEWKGKTREVDSRLLDW